MTENLFYLFIYLDSGFDTLYMIGFDTLYMTTRDWMCANETACLSIPDTTSQRHKRQLGIKKEEIMNTIPNSME